MDPEKAACARKGAGALRLEYGLPYVGPPSGAVYEKELMLAVLEHARSKLVAFRGGSRPATRSCPVVCMGAGRSPPPELPSAYAANTQR